MTQQPSSPKEPHTGEETGREIQARRQGLAYQGAIEGSVAILICAGAGYWLDTRFDTSPIWLLVGVVVGFTAFVLRLVRLGRQLEELRRAEAAQAGKSET